MRAYRSARPSTGAACSTGALIATVTSNGPSISLTPTANLKSSFSKTTRLPPRSPRNLACTKRRSIHTTSKNRLIQIFRNIPKTPVATMRIPGRLNMQASAPRRQNPLATASFVELDESGNPEWVRQYCSFHGPRRYIGGQFCMERLQVLPLIPLPTARRPCCRRPRLRR